MIKSLSTNSPFIIVSGGNPGSTYIGNYSNMPGVGNMRYNPNSQNIEVFDGNTWVILSSQHSSINLSSDAVSLLEWAREKRDEEFERELLAKTNPAIKDLVTQIKDKEEQIKIVQALIKEEVKV
jgi:hypothetical protein